MLGCRRRVESGGHDAGLKRCCDTEPCRWSPQAGAEPRRLEGLHRPRASLPVLLSRRRTNPHFRRRTRPANARPDGIKLQR